MPGPNLQNLGNDVLTSLWVHAEQRFECQRLLTGGKGTAIGDAAQRRGARISTQDERVHLDSQSVRVRGEGRWVKTKFLQVRAVFPLFKF